MACSGQVLARHWARSRAEASSSRYAAGEVTRELDLPASRVHVFPQGRPAWADALAHAHQSRRARHILFMGTLSVRKNVGKANRS